MASFRWSATSTIAARSTGCALRRSPCCISRRRRPTAGTTRARGTCWPRFRARELYRGTIVYISTSGVYGDCAGARVAETRPRRAHTPRARRRVAAEDRLRAFAARNGVVLSILRAPGIYAPTRLPLERLRHGTPALAPDDDVYTNHVHADDLARAVVAALFRGRPSRAYNVSDDGDMKMGAWFDMVADAFHLPRAPRVSWEDGGTADRAGVAVVHERVAAAVECAAEARAAVVARASDAARDAAGSRRASSHGNSRCRSARDRFALNGRDRRSGVHRRRGAG